MAFLVSLVGSRGSGKTTFLSYLSTKTKRTILSNFHLKVKNYKPLNIDVLLNLEKLNNVDVYLDEAYTWLESRISSSALNRYISYIIFQSRKRNVDIYTTAQMFSSVDLRFREQSDFIIFCNKRSNPNIDNFRYQFINMATMKVRNFIFPYEKASEYFSNFNTNQIIEPNQKGKLEFKILQQNPKRLLIKVKEISKQLEQQLTDYTHPAIKTALLFNGIELGYEQYVYLYLNNKVKL
jgi:Lhr-like helicase